ncbi:substrate-binding periplasmic protein [Rugamonas rivuli]|uniref:Transporter substrate-binding domain-containing protein n=1 Tax=Rugamonas rivuli TaxID=2743358 RepID=A0A843SGC5_9BURK|nr:ABC transporter substrate-binding protein [Rugamonas rivuli]MQA21180.1 transporter substrate-binding domain-containing protein [Rugamonas rivuli]
MFRVRSAMALAATLLQASACAAEPIALYTEDYPPFNWADKASGKVTGLSVDIVAELMRRAGVATAGPFLLPWARALRQTAITPNSCLYITARTPEREAKFQWIGPINRNDWVLFARRSDHIVLRNLDDAKPYKIGTSIDDASISVLREHQLQFTLTSSERLNPAKLQMGRIQLWSIGRLPGLSMLREMGIMDVEPVLTFIQADMYLSCNKSMDATEAARLNDVLHGMYRDGTIQHIYTRYGYEKEAPRLGAASR